MSDQFIITDHALDAECASLAKELFDEIMAGNEAEDAEDYRDDMDDRAHEAADGHQWVIYTHYARHIWASCNTDLGEEFVDDCGEATTDADKLVTSIVYGEIRGRIMEAVDELISDWEPAEDEDEDA